MKQLSPEWVKDFLRKKGRVVTVEQAAAIYDWMRRMARKTVAQYLRS